MRTFCLIVLFAMLALRIVAFAMDNSAEAATSTPVNQTTVQAVR